MKNKTKLVLMATGLSCAVLGCLGSATYAWFTTQNDIGVNHTNLTVATTNPNITVDMKRLTPSDISSVTLSGVQSINDPFTFSDVSSQFGETFYKKAQSGYSVVEANQLNGCVLQYGLSVTNIGLVTPMTLAITTSLTCTNTNASRSLRNWVRTGIYECTSSTFATKKEDGFACAVVYNIFEEYANKYINGVGEQNIATYADNTLFNYDAIVPCAQSVKDMATRYYKVSIWMEGTCDVNQDAAAGGQVAVSTTLSLRS